ncbi:glutaminase, partial [Streptomyces sp. AC627_RSS907]|uniref:glutaminase n=1 Tax=Streptomyces sp. AC627_RSS907 TaxID=2823684 RepID=UPI001C254266
VGDWEEPFSVQSISKTFSLALVLARDGEAIWRRVGREPSGNAFNSLVQLEYENGVPRNPFINAGALVVTDRLQTLTDDASTTLLDFLRAESDNPDLAFDPAVALSETEHGDRNAALAHFMASYGNLENPVPTVLQHYFWQCSIRMSCRDLALAGGFLARHGLRADGGRLLSRTEAKQVNAVMLT